jgi:WD40 repeat protein
MAKLWTVHDGAPAGEIAGGASFISTLAFSSRGDLLAMGREDGTVELWDRTRLRKLATLPADRGAVHAMAFSSDDRFLATGGTGPAITLWNLGALRGQLSELGLNW